MDARLAHSTMNATELPFDPDLVLPARVHLLGVGGAGVSGAARILAERGHTVSGHDRAATRFTEQLAAEGRVTLHVGPSHAAFLGDDVELVVRSAAVPLTDPQCVAAQQRGVEIVKYADLLGALAPTGRTLAVAGTHGKTTASWLLFHALRGVAEATGRGAPAPGALVGGICRTQGSNSLSEEPGGWFAVEACEYDRSFLRLSPTGAVVTNVDADHLDYYGTLDAIEEAFARFVSRVPSNGLVVLGKDVPARVAAATRAEVWRLGHELNLDLCGESRGRFRFCLRGPGWATPEVTLGLPGEFNVHNAALSLALAVGLAAREWRLEPSVAAAAAARGLERFVGAERRFEPWGVVGGVEVVHDYAHHPTEVRATLEAARRALPGKPIFVLFQPHQHSRTARFLDDFVESLRGVERVVISEVYGARAPLEAGEISAGADELARRLVRAGVDARAPGDLAASMDAVLDGLPGGSALLVMGAGDVDRIRGELHNRLALRCPAPQPPVV